MTHSTPVGDSSPDPFLALQARLQAALNGGHHQQLRTELQRILADLEASRPAGGASGSPDDCSAAPPHPKAIADARPAGGETLYQTVIQALPAHIAVIDPRGVIVTVNEAWRQFARLSGAPESAQLMDGANYLEICRRAAACDDGYAARALAGVESVLAGKTPQFQMVYPCDSPRQPLWFEMTVVPLGAHAASGAVISHLDVTQRKQIEAAHLAASAGAWEWDLRTNENIWSEGLWTVYGLAPGSCAPSYDAWLLTVHPDDRAWFEYAISEAVREGREFAVEWRLASAQGQQRWLMARGLPVSDSEGMVIRYVGTVMDISERKRTEAALRESERLLAESQAIAHIGGWNYDLVADLATYSEEAWRLFGFPPDGHPELNFNSFLRLLHPDDQAAMRDWSQACLAGQQPTGLEFRACLPDGSTRWLLGHGRLETDLNGAPLRMIGTVQDITDRKLNTAALRASEQRLAVALSAAEMGVWDWDLENQSVYWSPEVYVLFDVDDFDGTPEGFGRLVHEEDRAAVWAAVAESQHSGTALSVDYRVRRRSGTVRWLSARGQAARAGDGKARWLRGIVMDITERRRLYDDVRRNQVRLSTLVQFAMDAIISVDGQHRICLMNPAAEQLFGLSAADAIGQPIAQLIPERFRAEHEAHTRRFAKTGTTGRRMGALGTVIGLRADGQEIPLEASISKANEDDMLFTVILRDISDRLRAEQARELEEQRRREQQLRWEDQSRFLVARQTAAAIAHEMNQPLTAISSYTAGALRILQSPAPNFADLRYALEHTERQAQRAGQAIRELMELLQKGGTEVETFDLTTTLQTALEFIQHGEAQEDYTLELRVATGLRPVRANQLQVEKVVLNLIRNAFQAMREAGLGQGAITISAGPVAGSPMARVTVSDTGKGLDELALKSIFQPFYSTKATGLGMGLSVSRALIESLGGKLWAESNTGGGARFHFTLPFAP